jgi:RNA polymerase sigma-70 factor (ECF subfamily)
MLETPENFEEAYHAHSAAVYKFLFWRTKDAHVSEDLTSTTFQKAWASRSSFKGGSARAWFYRIARNTLFDYWRKHKELPSDDLPDLQPDERASTAELLDKEADLARLHAAFKKLPVNMREVVELRFIEELSSKEVAKKLGLSNENVRIIQYRALKKLREYLQ